MSDRGNVVELPDTGPVLDSTVVDSSSNQRELLVVDDLERKHLFGLDFVDAPGVEAVVDAVLDGPYLVDRLPLVVTPNTDIMMFLNNEATAEDLAMTRQAQFCLPDGQPIVLASRLVGRPLRSRLAGSDVFAALWPRLIEEPVSVAIVASSDDIARDLQGQHPSATIIVAPFFDADDSAAYDLIVDDLLDALGGRRPDLVMSGLSQPKDPRLMYRVIQRWPLELGPTPLCMSLGASFGMYLGYTRRAPRWMRRTGLEWFHRFCQEPRRLFHRYFVRDIAFWRLVWAEWQIRDTGPRSDDER